MKGTVYVINRPLFPGDGLLRKLSPFSYFKESIAMADLEFIRSNFPAFSEPSLQGWGFFENAGGSYACKQTIECLNRY